MNDEEFRIAAAIRRVLDSEVERLDAGLLRDLEGSRQHALQHQRTTHNGFRLAGKMGLISGDFLLPHARTFAAISALMLGMIGTYYWNSFEDADDYAEIDSALLADDLPVAAYSDQGFHAWLDHSPASSSP